MDVTLEMIKSLRAVTGAGIMDCKKALEEAGGDVEKAKAALRQRGMAIAQSRADRVTKEGIIEAYIHPGSRVAAMVEINCETDFVARTDVMKQLAHDIAMQVAAMNPKYVSLDDVPREEASGESDSREIVLLLQPFIKDPAKTVEERVAEAVAQVGEKLQLRRFTRYALGE